MNEELWASYAVALQFFSETLQHAPDAALLAAIHRDDLFRAFEDCPCFRAKAGQDAGEHDDPARSIALLTRHCASRPAGRDADGPDFAALAAELRQDHLALFSGPAPASPPWESVWRERDKLLYGERTEEVFHCYQDWGIAAEKAGREPEDHLGLELAFALFLVRAMPGGESAPRARSGQNARQALLGFLEEHMLPWAGLCLRKAREHAGTVFYRENSLLCAVMLRNLHEDLIACAAQ